MSTLAIVNILIWVQIVLGLIAIVMLSRMIYIASTFLHGDVPFVPTRRKVAKRMAELAELKPGMNVCDLGSGSGTILIALADREPEAKYTGYEISKLLCLATRLKLLFNPKARRTITIKCGDFFKIDLSDYNVVTCFLMRTIMDRLYPKFLRLKPGAKIVSYLFPLENNDGFSMKTESAGGKDFIYIYTRLP